MRYLTFDFSEAAEGLTTIEAMASTAAAQHSEVMAEVQQILDWAWANFPDTHGSIEDGAHWDHDVQVSVERGEWHAVALTLSASATFTEEFLVAFAHRGE